MAMTQTLSDLRGMVTPKPAPAKPKSKPSANKTHQTKINKKFSIDAVLAVVPPNAKIAAQWALTTFPIAFPPQPHKIRPLAIGISAELKTHIERASPPLPEGEFTNFMFWWCHRGAYLRATVAGGKRIQLSGELAEDLTEQAIDHARKILERKVKGASQPLRSPSVGS